MNFKQAILSSIDRLGLNRRARYRTRRRLLGLCYHTVVPDGSPVEDARTRIAVTVSDFDRQMDELRRHWTPVSTAQVRAALLDGAPLPDFAVHVSFDDGYRNNLTLAAPILAKYEIPATVFITTELIGTQNLVWALELHERLVAWPKPRLRYSDALPPLTLEPHMRHLEKTLEKNLAKTPPETPERSVRVFELVHAAKRLSPVERDAFLDVLRAETQIDLTPPWKRDLYELLDWDQVRGLRDRGIDIGAHTLTHPNLALLEPEELDRELRGSKSQIERELGISCDVLAYPFGAVYHYSDSVVAAARNLGFRLAFTLQNRRNGLHPDPMRIHRFCVHREHTLPSFRFMISGFRET